MYLPKSDPDPKLSDPLPDLSDPLPDESERLALIFDWSLDGSILPTWVFELEQIKIQTTINLRVIIIGGSCSFILHDR